MTARAADAALRQFPCCYCRSPSRGGTEADRGFSFGSLLQTPSGSPAQRRQGGVAPCDCGLPDPDRHSDSEELHLIYQSLASPDI